MTAANLPRFVGRLINGWHNPNRWRAAPTAARRRGSAAQHLRASGSAPYADVPGSTTTQRQIAFDQVWKQLIDDGVIDRKGAGRSTRLRRRHMAAPTRRRPIVALHARPSDRQDQSPFDRPTPPWAATCVSTDVERRSSRRRGGPCADPDTTRTYSAARDSSTRSRPPHDLWPSRGLLTRPSSRSSRRAHNSGSW